MKRKIPLAWLQVSRERSRLLVAMAGIAFADMLMFIQLGFRTALYESNTQLHRAIRADLVLLSPQARNIVNLTSIPRRRLYQAKSLQGVQSVQALYADFVDWKHPQTKKKTSMLLLGSEPTRSPFNLAGVDRNLDKLKYPDTVLLDTGSRGDYSTTIQAVQQGQSVPTEIRERQVNVKGLFLSGASFAADGNVMTSDVNFLRVMANRKASEVSVGLITLEPGVDPNQMAAALRLLLPHDVKVLTRKQFAQFEEDYWAENTSIGFIFNLGTAIGFVVGTVIVYQILSSDVADHMAEYATLKAMGFRDWYLLSVIFQEALILAILGFIPGYAISYGLYGLTRSATNLPLFMTLSRATTVFVLTILMCLVSGAIATRKLRSADPADVF
ncbi:MAG: ABC transporter permease DevC [Leptodesmis sp.]|uniref:ABC transporter permease DevC n=1 Tax=Leptodesmis sp. TaxID=3100501 RepID=UPI003D0A81C9